MSDWVAAPVFGAPPAAGPATPRLSAYAVVSDGRRQVAVVRTPSGLYLPGGGVEPGETAADAAVREAREECGLTIAVGPWVACAVKFVHAPTEAAHFEKRSTFVEARVNGPPAVPTEADHALCWVSPAEAAARLTPASHRWAVAQWHTRGGTSA